MKRVAIVGSGNVAEAFALALASGETYRLVQIFARNAVRRSELERLTGLATPPTTPAPALAPADIYIIAVSDDSVGTVSSGLTEQAGLDFGDAVVAHTAGSVALDELDAHIVNRGVIYPLQTFTAGYHINFSNVPLFVEGATPEAENRLLSLARALSDNVTPADSRQRLAIHIAAVFAGNFTNSMYAIGQRLLKENGLEPHLLDPLILQTAVKATEAASAAEVQTGPARRGDTTTMEKHLRMLQNMAGAKDGVLAGAIYKLLSSNIWETSKKI